jgi:hypothetical protein
MLSPLFNSTVIISRPLHICIESSTMCCPAMLIFGHCSHTIQSRMRSRISGRYRADSILLSLPSTLNTAAQDDLRTLPYVQCRGDLRTIYNAHTAPDIATVQRGLVACELKWYLKQFAPHADLQLFRDIGSMVSLFHVKHTPTVSLSRVIDFCQTLFKRFNL